MRGRRVSPGSISREMGRENLAVAHRKPASGETMANNLSMACMFEATANVVCSAASAFLESLL
jgi:hypothetical protein